MVYGVNIFAMPGMQHVIYALEYKVFALVLPLWSAHPILTLHSGSHIPDMKSCVIIGNI